MNNVDKYDNSRKFIFSNWTNEDFSAQWDAVTYTIKAGETKEYEMYLAYHLAKHLVDRELIKAGKDNLMGVPEERDALEAKTIAEITAGMDSPALSSLKEQIRKEMEDEKNGKEIKEAPLKKPSKTDKVEKKEFEGIN